MTFYFCKELTNGRFAQKFFAPRRLPVIFYNSKTKNSFSQAFHRRAKKGEYPLDEQSSSGSQSSFLIKTPRSNARYKCHKHLGHWRRRHSVHLILTTMITKSFSNKLTALAAAVILCCSVLFIQSNARAQSPCANFSLGQIDPSTLAGWVLTALNGCVPTDGSCSDTACADCRYVGFSNTGPCLLTSMDVSDAGACFSLCAVFGNPILWEYWSSPNSSECDAFTKHIIPDQGFGLGGHGALQMKVCGKFPMLLTICVTDCVTGLPCCETITVI